MAENIADEIVGDVEELFDFQPKPGGMIERHRTEKARREAAQKEKEQSEEKIEERGYKAVKTIVLSPEVLNVNIVNIPNGGTGQILPNAPYRSRAVIIGNVSFTIGKDQGQALSAGFPIAAATPFVVNSRAQLWATANNGALTITAYTESYGPELAS